MKNEGHRDSSAEVPCVQRGVPTGKIVDFVAVEEPLEILVDGVPVSVVMRTPGADAELVRGFLLSEGIIHAVDAVADISFDWGANKACVFLQEGQEVDLSSLSRHVFSASSCGICGKASIEAVMRDLPVLPRQKVSISEEMLMSLVKVMETRQKTFEQTGGLHAAALFSTEGKMLILREDVGRHNAVDKVIGGIGADELRAGVLVVSGRISFEIVQKAATVGIGMLAAVSAPSSLAIDLARECGMTLVGFLRPPRWNHYVDGAIAISPLENC